MKTSELEGSKLDLLVAKIEGYDVDRDKTYAFYTRSDGTSFSIGKHTLDYSTCWSQGGPLIEKYGIDIESGALWQAMIIHVHHHRKTDIFIQNGPTPLIAAMRALVASVYGDEIDAKSQ